MKKLLLGIILIAFGITINAQTTYVNINATGANNGTSWANAYTDLHSATYNTTAGQIWVAQGTYTPSQTATGTVPANISQKTFRIRYNVKVYGGFLGTETSLSQRNWRNNTTILSGQLDVTTKAYNVVKFDANTNITVLDGFTVQDGEAIGTTEVFGGAVFMTNSASPTIRNCKFVNNITKQHGGAIYASGGSPKFENCEFKNNRTNLYDGGALYIVGATSTTIVNCLFNGNISTRHGGSMVLINTTSSDVRNCTFVNNQNGAGGIASVILLSATVGSPIMRINNCIFYGNTPAGGWEVDLNAGSYTAKNCYSNYGNLSFQNNSGLINIISGTPDFTDFSNGDFTLQCSSPAVNTGDTIGFVVPLTDLNGNIRVSNTSIDMGAYENNITETTINVTEISATQTGATYRWLDCNNAYAVISGETTQTFTPTINGNYAVEVTINSCTDTSICKAFNSVSLLNIENTDFTLFPNPANKELTIRTNETVETISIFNLLGELILEETKNNFSIENLPLGMYILKIKTNKGTGTTRFIKN